MAQNPGFSPDSPIRGQTLASYVSSLWGDGVILVPKQIIPVLTTPTRVLKNNPRRFEAMIVNRGTGQVDLDWNPSLILGDGIPLGSLATFNLTAFEDGELVGYDLYAISSAAGNSLAVYEVQTR
jgi:hypothetical protein